MGKSSLEEYMAKMYGGDKKRKRIDEEVNSEHEKVTSLHQINSEIHGGSTFIKNVKSLKDNSFIKNDLANQQKIKAVENLKKTNGENPMRMEKQQEETTKISLSPAVSMRRGGLQAHNEITAELERKEKKIQMELRTLQRLGADKHATIHRDSNGRQINPTKVESTDNKISKVKSYDEKKRKMEKFNKNEANIAKERQMREKLKMMKNERINIYENDKKHINEQKETIQSEDPALMFDKNIIEKHKELVDKQFVSITGRKLYNDVTHYPMNRFNIKPGWRWDGILRGNGFEQKWHDAQLQKRS